MDIHRDTRLTLLGFLRATEQHYIETHQSWKVSMNKISIYVQYRKHLYLCEKRIKAKSLEKGEWIIWWAGEYKRRNFDSFVLNEIPPNFIIIIGPYDRLFMCTHDRIEIQFPPHTGRK